MYSDEDVNRWLKMYNDGKSHEEIGLEERVSTQTIGKRLRAHPDYTPRQATANEATTHRHRFEDKRKPGSKAVKSASLNARKQGHRRRSRGW